MTNSEFFLQTIDRFIELYGDRAGGRGDAIQGGFAWIQDTKVILLAGGGKNLQQPSDWRRLSRLLSLAQQLRRPVLLWHLPFQIAANPSREPVSLIHNAIPSSKLQLLKLPSPIVGVFFDEFPPSLESELAMVDGAVIMESQGEIHPRLPASMNDNLVILKIPTGPTTLKSKIMEVLHQISAIPGETLVNHRMDRIRKVALNPDLIGAALSPAPIGVAHQSD